MATHELYERHARQIYAYCVNRLRSREEAEDAVQSTFLNAFRGLQRGIEPRHELAWLYKIAENVCLTRARSSVRRRRVETPNDLDAVADILPAPEQDAEELMHLPEALQAMPEQQRRALLLREWQGLSYREIAEELELSQPAVETLLFRARRTLAAGLTDEPKKGRVVRRLRAGGDAGALLGLLKTLLFSGAGKAVVAGAVAASTVAAASPNVRHAVEHAVAPRTHAAPVPVSHALPAAARSVAPAPKAKPKPVRHAAAHGAPADLAARPAQHVSWKPSFVPPGQAKPAGAPAAPQAARKPPRHEAGVGAGGGGRASKVDRPATASPRSERSRRSSAGEPPRATPNRAPNEQAKTNGNAAAPAAGDSATEPVLGAPEAVVERAEQAAQGVANGLGHAK